jgi:hypothetical protein
LAEGAVFASSPSLRSWSRTVLTRYIDNPVRCWMSRAYRVWGDVRVAALLDKTDDAFVVGEGDLHTMKTLSSAPRKLPGQTSVPLGSLGQPFVGSILTFWRISEAQLAVSGTTWTLNLGEPTSTSSERTCAVAKVTQVSLVDDVDGSAADETVHSHWKVASTSSTCRRRTPPSFVTLSLPSSPRPAVEAGGAGARPGVRK